MDIYTTENEEKMKILREKIPPLDLKKEDKKQLRELIKKMRSVMVEQNGVGLAANQIGIKKRLFVAQVPNKEGRIKFYTIINPEIIKEAKEKISMEEGCLSVPGELGSVPRAAAITLVGQNPSGRKIKIKAWGLLARVFQHEVDHLNGKLITDKME